MSRELKSIFFRVALVSTIVAAMPIGFAKTPAQAEKVLRVAFPAPDDGFDMVKTFNFYSGNVADVIFERLVQYDYLANPVKLVPATAQSLPIIEKNGQVYTFKIKSGIYFTDDPAFKGKRRELVAEDYVYSIKRILDPKNHAPSFSFIDNKLVGANALVDQANKTGRFEYDAKIEGVKALDKYTIQFKLTQPDYNFPYILAYSTFGATAREVVEYYKDQLGMHPVGTGPYMLSRYVPRSKIELIANPDYRGFVWNFKSTGTAWDNQLVKQMSGKRMPQIGKVNISIIEEEQSRWLAFQSKQLDFDTLTSSAIPKALDQNNQLNAAMQQKGIRLYANKEAEVTYTMFNMRDPVVGGNSLEKIALRRAITMSFNLNEYIRILRKGQAVRAEMLVPAGVNGHNSNYRSSVGYNPVLANKLLDHFGYKKGTDGYRRFPNGKALTLKINTESGSSSVMYSELWKKNLDAIGIRAEFKVSNFADNLKAATQCQYMMWSGAWHADYPEGENFTQLLYGANIGRGNQSCYKSAGYDGLYQQAMKLAPDQRMPFYEKMSRQVEADNPWILQDTRIRNWVIQPEVQGFKAHPIMNTNWQYLDIVPSQQNK